MKKKVFIFIPVFLLVIFLCSSCSTFNPSHGIMSFGQTRKDIFQTLEGTMTTESLVIIPIGSSLKDDDKMGLKIGRYSLDGNITKYAFQAELHASLGVIENNNFKIKIDDNLYTLEDNNPFYRIISNNYYLTVLTVEILPEMLEELKFATTFSAELYRRVVNLNEKQLQVLKDFLI